MFGASKCQAGVTGRTKTMTRSHGLNALKAITLGAVLSMTAGFAFAGDNVSTDQIINALQPKPLTRGLSVGEREEIADIASTKPNIDLDIQFDYNSADISTTSMPAVQALGKALSNPSLKGSTFVVAGHTDAIGGEAYTQAISERGPDSIKRYLTEKYGIAGSDLVTVGYGKDKPKDPNAPMDPINRRVQVVNMVSKTASK